MEENVKVVRVSYDIRIYDAKSDEEAIEKAKYNLDNFIDDFYWFSKIEVIENEN